MTIEDRLEEMKEHIEENRKLVREEQEKHADKLTAKVIEMHE